MSSVIVEHGHLRDSKGKLFIFDSRMILNDFDFIFVESVLFKFSEIKVISKIGRNALIDIQFRN